MLNRSSRKYTSDGFERNDLVNLNNQRDRINL